MRFKDKQRNNYQMKNLVSNRLLLATGF